MSDLYEKISDLAKRRGFFWPSYEIYGGVSGFYDLGPYGVLLKQRIVERWRELFVRSHQEYVVELESPLIAPSIVFEASGHVEHFTDPIVTCKGTGRRYRADHLVEEALGISVEGMSTEEIGKIMRERGVKCPDGGEPGDVTTFNLLFKTQIGPYEGDVGYLRPELAQGMFVAFRRVLEAMRNRLPLGIAQIGRVGRNEISPRQAMIRLREFTIMEMEYFIDPEDKEDSCPFFEERAGTKLKVLSYEAKIKGSEPQSFTVEEAVREKVIVDRCLAYWMAVGQEFVEGLGVPAQEIVFVEKGPSERAHYSTQTFDQVVRTSRWGWIEVAGHSYRGDYDLSRHMSYSKTDLTVFKQYKEPVNVKVKRVVVDKGVLGRLFREKTLEVFSKLQSLPPEEVEKQLSREGRVVVDGYVVSRETLRVEEVEERVTGKKVVPHVVEPSFGADRALYVTFEYAYREREGRVILAFPRSIAPVQAAVFPLLENDPELLKVAREIYGALVREGFYVLYDDSGSIGRRYARADELGVPAAVTVDYKTLEDTTVTVRDRDSWNQVRVRAEELPGALRKFLRGGPLESLP